MGQGRCSGSHFRLIGGGIDLPTTFRDNIGFGSFRGGKPFVSLSWICLHHVGFCHYRGYGLRGDRHEGHGEINRLGPCALTLEQLFHGKPDISDS